MKIVTVVGARPQVIKAAPLSRLIRDTRDTTEIIVHTGQHYDAIMSDVFFEELGITEANYNLGVGSASHGRQTGVMMEGIETVLLSEQPEVVVVYGDTNSTLSGALAGAKLNIPIAHVEAGLRSYNRSMPEEINRIVTDHVARLLFCPNAEAVGHLKREGVTEGVYEVGDVMYDCHMLFAELASEREGIHETLGLASTSAEQSYC